MNLLHEVRARLFFLIMRAYFIYPAMKVPVCSDFVVTSPGVISLGAANYYTVRFAPASSTFLEVLGLSSRGDRPAETLNREWTFVVRVSIRRSEIHVQRSTRSSK